MEAGEGPGFKVSAPIPPAASAAAAALDRGPTGPREDHADESREKAKPQEAGPNIAADSRELVRSPRELEAMLRILDSVSDERQAKALRAELPSAAEVLEMEESEESSRRNQIEQLAHQMALWGYQYGRSGGPSPKIEVTWHEGSPIFTDATHEDDIGGLK